jgi:hypothetical protein
VRLEFDPDCFGAVGLMQILAVLVQRAGGTVVLTQREIKELGECLHFTLVEPGTDVRVETRS